MMQFVAKIRERDGSVKTIKKEAENESALASFLRAEGKIILKIKEEKRRRNHWGWVTSFEKEIALRSLASMLKSGVAIIDALETLAKKENKAKLALVFSKIEERVLSGEGIGSAMEMEGAIFGKVPIELVKVGEHSGEIIEALLHAALWIERRRTIRESVLNALSYPAIALFAAVGVSVYLVTNVIPKISDFLTSSNATLPAITLYLMEISHYIRLHGSMILLTIVAIIAIILCLNLTTWGKDFLSHCALRLPIVGRILRISGTAVFARAMSILLSSGITLLGALEISQRLIPNARLAHRIHDSHTAILAGKTLGASLKQGNEFMPMLSEMASVGEKTGALDEAFLEVASFHENLLSLTVKRFGMTIEPIMIAITASIVGFVYIAFFSALFSMAGAV